MLIGATSKIGSEAAQFLHDYGAFLIIADDNEIELKSMAKRLAIAPRCVALLDKENLSSIVKVSQQMEIWNIKFNYIFIIEENTVFIRRKPSLILCMENFKKLLLPKGTLMEFNVETMEQFKNILEKIMS